MPSEEIEIAVGLLSPLMFVVARVNSLGSGLVVTLLRSESSTRAVVDLSKGKFVLVGLPFPTAFDTSSVTVPALLANESNSSLPPSSVVIFSAVDFDCSAFAQMSPQTPSAFAQISPTMPQQLLKCRLRRLSICSSIAHDTSAFAQLLPKRPQ